MGIDTAHLHVTDVTELARQNQVVRRDFYETMAKKLGAATLYRDLAAVARRLEKDAMEGFNATVPEEKPISATLWQSAWKQFDHLAANLEELGL